MSQDYKYGELTSKIIAAAMEVHNTLGNGFQEITYQRALAIELNSKQIEQFREVEMPLYYKGIEVGKRRVDFLIDNKISVELKAISKLEDVHLAQALNYLEAFNLEVGLLINFGSRSLEFKRLLNRKYNPSIKFQS